MNAAGKRKKRSKKKSEEKTKELITPQDTLTEVKEDEKQENTTIQKKESVKEAEDIIDLVVNDSIFSSRNEEIDLDDEDDDDVPSELLSVEWKNPSLNVESELTDVLDIIEPAHSTISLNNLDNEAQVSLQTGLSEHFFETPLVGEGGNSSPQRDSDEHNSVPKECVTYTSAWGPCIAPELSDDDESVEVRISTPMVKVEVQDNEEVIPNDAALNISLEQWVKESLKGHSVLLVS